MAETRVPDTLSFRPAAADDQDFLIELSSAAFSEYTPGAGPRTLRMLDQGSVQTLVAELGHRRVGFAAISLARRVAHLDAIAVIARVRGQGVGRELLRRAESVAVRAGKPALELVTADANLAALDLFLRSGYAVVERLPRFYARGQNALRLAKRL